MADSAGLDKIVFVEDSFASFRSLMKLSEKFKIDLCFGVKLPIGNDETELGKMVFFALNSAGVLRLKQLYTKSALEGLLKIKDIPKSDADILVAVPHYDSPLFKNHFYFCDSICDVSQWKPVQFVEENDHPFDFLIKNAVDSFCNLHSIEQVKVKTVVYETRKDAETMQMYAAVHNRSGGKSPTYDNPNLEHFCSPEFSFESFLANAKK